MLLFKWSVGLNRVSKYIGRRPGLFNADCYKQSEALFKDVEALRKKLFDFFSDNGLSDAEEFIDERISMLTPPLEEPENPELERSEIL